MTYEGPSFGILLTICLLTCGFCVIIVFLASPIVGPELATQFGAISLVLVIGIWLSFLGGIWSRLRSNLSGWILLLGLIAWALIGAGLYAIIPGLVGLSIIVVGFFSYLGYALFKADSDNSLDIIDPGYDQGNAAGTSGRKPGMRFDSFRRGKRKPKYWNSKKGEVLRAIADAQKPLTFQELLSHTDIPAYSLITAIDELMKKDALRNTSKGFKAKPSLYRAYREHLEKSGRKKTASATRKSKLRTKGRKHRTRNGEMVRSKSETIIANTLASLGLEYEYEKPLSNPQNSRDKIHPDFTIYRAGKTYYWEHLGMLGIPKYKRSWEWKRNWYAMCGYSDQLITSRDGPDGSLDSSLIEDIARRRILGE